MATKKKAPADETVQQLPVGLVKPDPRNARREADDELVDSIRDVGIVHPLLVTPVDGKAGQGWTIVSGERRWRAAKKAKLSHVPCVVRAYDGVERRRVQLLSDLERKALTPTEEAAGMAELRDEHGMRQRDIAKALHVSQSHVSKRLALMRLPARVRELVDAGDVPVADAEVLARLDDDQVAKVLEEAALDAPSHAWGSLRMVAERAVARQERERRREKLVAEQERAGHTVLDRPPGYQPLLIVGDDPPPATVHVVSWHRQVDVDAHHELDCHAVAIDVDARDSDAQVIACCTDPARHPLHEPDVPARDDADGEPLLEHDSRDGALDEDPALRERIDRAHAEEARIRQLDSARDTRQQAMAKLVRSIDDWTLDDDDGLLDHVLRRLIDLAIGSLNAGRITTAASMAIDHDFRHGHEARSAIATAAGEREGSALVALATAVVLARDDYGAHPVADSTIHRAHLQLLAEHGYQPTPIETDELLARSEPA